MDIDESQDHVVKKTKSKYGQMIFDRFMQYLDSDDAIWRAEAPCVQKHGHARAKAKTTKAQQHLCLTPVGLAAGRSQTEQAAAAVTVASAGSTCTDVSAIGQMSGLLGKSTEPLCIWLSERRRLREAGFCHFVIFVLVFRA